MVCNKVVIVCERRCVWQESVWQSVVWKLVCDKDLCERLCVKAGVCVWQSCVCVWKIVCERLCVTKTCVEDCGRWCVTKFCVKYGLWQRWCVTKLCVKNGVWQRCAWQRWFVKDGVWQRCVWKMVCHKHGVTSGVYEMVCDKVVCERWCVTRMRVKLTMLYVWHATRASPVPCHLCYACQAKPGGCGQAPHLPRKVKVDVAKSHACHAKVPWRHGDQPRPSAPPEPSAMCATRNDGGCRQVPRLPCERKVDVAKCHTCHAKVPRRHGDQPRPSAAPEPAHKLHACQAKRWLMSPSATSATRNDGRFRQVPRLPRETKMDVTKCHACHVKRRWMSPSATPATPKCRGVGDQPRPSAPLEPAQSHISAMPATRNERGCRQMPHLPRETMVDVAKCHTCQVKRRWMPPSATPAMWKEGGCRQVPHLPRKSAAASRRPTAPERGTRASP